MVSYEEVQHSQANDEERPKLELMEELHKLRLEKAELKLN